MEVVNADHAGVIFCEVLWNQELVIEIRDPTDFSRVMRLFY